MMHDFEVTGYELISKDGETHIYVCYECFEEKIPELRETHNIKQEFPIYYSDEIGSLSKCDFCKDSIEQTLKKA